MGVHDVDKTSDSRNNPTLNTPDLDKNRKALGTASISPRDETASNLAARVVIQDDKIIIYDDSNSRIIIGRLPNGVYGWAVSKAGNNVEDAF